MCIARTVCTRIRTFCADREKRITSYKLKPKFLCPSLKRKHEARLPYVKIVAVFFITARYIQHPLFFFNVTTLYSPSPPVIYNHINLPLYRSLHLFHLSKERLVLCSKMTFIKTTGEWHHYSNTFSHYAANSKKINYEFHFTFYYYSRNVKYFQVLVALFQI